MRLSVAASLALGGCSNACANEELANVPAPGGEHKAVLFRRDCGATTGSSSQVSVLRAADEFTKSGNVFVADDGHGAAAAALWGGPWADVRWLSPTHLLVSYDAHARRFKMDGSRDGIRITFRKVARPPA